MAEHSPLPWRRMKDDNYAWIVDSENYLVVRTDNHANRDLIMRAVNSHADLVFALRDLLNVSTEPGVMDVDQWKEWKKRSEHEARAALAKAGEQCD